MPSIARPVAALALTAAALTATAGTAAAATTIPDGLCDGQAFSTPFAALGDAAPYALVPGGGFESGLAGWLLSGTPVVIRDRVDNLGAGGDAHALSVPAGSSVTSPLMCVTLDYPYFRFFARSKSKASASRLKVEVIYEGTTPATVIPVAQLDGSTMTKWQATPQLRTGVVLATIAANLSAAKAILSGTADVTSAGAMRVRLTAVSETWEVDDIYVDPKMR